MTDNEIIKALTLQKKWRVETMNLEKCPFCGSETELQTISRSRQNIYCAGCGAVVMFRKDECRLTAGALVAAYNRRSEERGVARELDKHD